MNSVSYLIPISLGLGLIALGAFLWSLDREQYEDLEGAASRILTDKDAPATVTGTIANTGRRARRQLEGSTRQRDDRIKDLRRSWNIQAFRNVQCSEKQIET